MDIKNILILIVAVFNILLGLVVLLNGRKRLVNLSFAFLSLGVFSWSTSMVIYRLVPTVEGSVFWCRILYIAPVFCVAALLLFTHFFYEREIDKKRRGIIAIYLGGALIFFTGIIGFTNGIVKDVTIIEPGLQKAITFGNWYFLYFIFILGTILWSYANLIGKRRTASGIARNQINYVFWGVFLASLMGIVANLILPTFGIFNWMDGQIFTVLMVVFIAYAILRHRLMGVHLMIRLIAKNVLVAILTAVITFVFMVLVYMVSAMLWNHVLNLGSFLTILILTVLFILFFTPLLEKIRQLGNYLFLRNYNPTKILRDFYGKVREAKDLKNLFEILDENLTLLLEARTVKVILFQFKDGKLKAQPKRSYNFEEIFKKIPLGKTWLYEKIMKEKKLIVRDELEDEEKRVLGEMNRYGASVVIPLIKGGQLLGVVILGDKIEDEEYSQDDLYLLENMQKIITKRVMAYQ